MFASADGCRRDPALLFAGALAISTYFSSLSNDYNLITAYPLLIMLFIRATSAPWSSLATALLLVGLVAIVAIERCSSSPTRPSWDTSHFSGSGFSR